MMSKTSMYAALKENKAKYEASTGRNSRALARFQRLATIEAIFIDEATMDPATQVARLDTTMEALSARIDTKPGTLEANLDTLFYNSGVYHHLQDYDRKKTGWNRTSTITRRA